MEDKLEAYKKEIRSLLISYQKGTSLSEFRKEYRNMIGRNLPFKELGFKDEYSFLNAMPDAVKVYNSPVPGDYHLYAVADKSIKHIQKMVTNQKTSKHKTKYRAPRETSSVYTKAPSYASNYRSSRGHPKSYELPPRFSREESPREIPKGVDTHVIKMLEHYPNGVKLSDFLATFSNHYKRQFLFRDWGFSTLEECLESIPGLFAKNKNNDIIVNFRRTDPDFEQCSSFATTNYSTSNTASYLTSSATKYSTINAANYSTSNTANYSTSNTANYSSNQKENVFPKSNDSLQPPVVKSSSTAAGDYFDREFTKAGKLKTTYVNDNVQDTWNTNAAGRMTGNSASNSILKPVSLIDEPFQATGMTRSTTSHSIPKPISLIDEPFPATGLNKGSTTLSSTYKISPFQFKDTSEGYRYNQVPSSTSRADTLDEFPLVDFRTTEPKTNVLLRNNFTVESDDRVDLNSISFNETEDDHISGVSPFVRNDLVKVIENYPHGIFAVKFSSCYESVTGKRLDLHSLGFTSLSEFVDAVPDILVRKPFTGSKKDWIIYSAKSVPKEDASSSNPNFAECSVMFVENVILNVRKILQANTEGIPLSKFIHNYSINCTEPLYVRDLGFDSLESLLKSIATRVPLQIVNIEGEKTVQFMGFEETVIPPPVPHTYKPPDSAPLNTKFKPFEFSSNYNYGKYFPVYTSSIASPALLYIQFDGEEYGDKLKDLYDDIEQFYSSRESDSYRVHPNDIKVDLVCVALWPVDKHWYRARITSIVSMDFVQVFYEDYGTTDEIPMTMLRYIKMEYMDLPAQAVKARLAYLKAPTAHGDLTTSAWGLKTRKRMLELCKDRPLMAKIENIDSNGVLALVLCDTNSEVDFFINDALMEEHLAEGCGEYDEPEQIASALSTASAQNIHQLLLDIVTKLRFPTNFPNNLQNLPMNVPALNQAPLGYAPQQTLVNQQFSQLPVYNNPNYNMSTSTISSPIDCPKYPPGFQFPNMLQTTINAPEPAASAPSPASSPIDDEIFDDADDEYFEQLCQRSLSATKRFVKRVKTTDGYFFHILLWESKPYISSGDLSILIWPSRSSDYLFHKLQAKNVELESITLSDIGNEEFFSQLERFRVKGVEAIASELTILLHPLAKTNNILNMFGHPSATLRAKIKVECETFNPSSSLWQELPDHETAEEIEELKLVTDDDKMNRLCLYDLKVMREGIRCKRKKLLENEDSQQSSPDLEEEINKLNQLFAKVRERIIEIEQICEMFSSQT